MKLPVVVVFYNPTKENIENILVYKKKVDKIYIVDNSDDDIQRAQNDDKIEYIKFGENKGIATALNEAAKRAIESKYEWLLTLDQDSKITQQNIADMQEFIVSTKEENIGLIAPYQDIGLEIIKNDEDYQDIIEVMTSGSIINLEAYKKIGGFKDWLFIDCVDTDYCMNLHKNNYKVIRLNKVVMKHNLGNLKLHNFLGKTYDCFNHNPVRRYYIVRNNLYINEMYHDIFPKYCEHLINAQKGQVKRIMIFEKNKFKKIKMMYRGYKDFKKGIKGKLVI